MTKNILKLSAAVIIGLYAQAAHATNTGWTAEEYEALRKGDSSSWKYIGKEAVDAGGDLDNFVAQLGTGGVDVLKAKLGIPGATSAEDDLNGLIDRVDDNTANQTLAGAITAVKNAINTGVAGDSLLEDVNNEADRLFGGPAASLKAAIDATLAANPFPGAGLALIPTVGAATALADITAQRDRIDNTAPASISAALDNVDALVPPNAALVQDLTAIQGTIGAGGDIPAAIAAQIDRIDNTPAASIDAALDNVDALVPVNADLVQDLTAIRGTIDGAAAADIPAAIAAQIDRTATAAVAAPASISAGIDALQAVIGGANPVTGANADAAKALVGGAAATITADVTAQIARIDSTGPVSISAALDNVDALVPPNAGLVQDLTAIQALIDPVANIPTGVANLRTGLINKLNNDKAVGGLTLAAPLVLDGAGDVDPADAGNTLTAILAFILTKDIQD